MNSSLKTSASTTADSDTCTMQSFTTCHFSKIYIENLLNACPVKITIGALQAINHSPSSNYSNQSISEMYLQEMYINTTQS